MDRRVVIKSGTSALVLTIIFRCSDVDAQQSASVIWYVPRDQVQTVREALNFQGQIIPKTNSDLITRGAPLLFVLAGTISIPLLAHALIDVYRDFRYGGVVVNVNNGKIDIKNDPRMPSGTIIVYDARGISIYQVNPEYDADAVSLIKALMGITSEKGSK